MTHDSWLMLVTYIYIYIYIYTCIYIYIYIYIYTHISYISMVYFWKELVLALNTTCFVYFFPLSIYFLTIFTQLMCVHHTHYVCVCVCVCVCVLTNTSWARSQTSSGHTQVEKYCEYFSVENGLFRWKVMWVIDTHKLSANISWVRSCALVEWGRALFTDFWALSVECEALCVRDRALVVDYEALSVDCRPLLVEFCRGQFWVKSCALNLRVFIRHITFQRRSFSQFPPPSAGGHVKAELGILRSC